nr:HNH endonuclease signature motif containing protein [Microbacterium bovistercoris]
MRTAPAELLETLTRLDELLGDDVHATLDGDITRTMTDDELVAFTRVSESLGRRADALRIAAAGEIDVRSRSELGEERLSARAGCMNAVDLLCRLTRVAATSARARIRHAHAVATRTTLTGDPLPAAFPTVRDALVDGVIGVDSIAAIVGALAPISDRCDPTHLAAAEYELVAAATGAGPDGAPACSADDSRTQAKVWTLVLDPDGTLPDYERALRHRGLRFGRERDGIVPISGGLLADVAAQFQRMGDAQLNPRVHDGTEDPGVRFRDAAEDDGDDAPPDTRTREQKMHDVFATILGVAARSAETPSLGGLPPTLLVTISAVELDRDDGVGFIDGTDDTVPAVVARQIACCGGIQRLVIDENGRLIELGSPNRTFSGQQRRAITARDGECIIPGCHVSATWCEIHHVIEHARGGPTHVDNGVPLCWWHHRSLETSGWEIRMVDGVPEVRAPATIDPRRLWQRVPGSLHRARDRLNRRLTG